GRDGPRPATIAFVAVAVRSHGRSLASDAHKRLHKAGVRRPDREDPMGGGVTGGSGTAGRWVVRHLRGLGHDVLNVDVVRDASGEGESVLVDLGDAGQTLGGGAGADAIVHLAAIPAPGIHAPAETFRNNAMSTYNVFAAAVDRGVDRVVWASSETVQ